MDQVTVKDPGNPVGSALNSDLKCESCEGRHVQLVPGETEALSVMNEVCAALQEVREIAERMDLSMVLAGSEGAAGEIQDDPDVQETKSQIDVQPQPMGSVKDPDGAVATEKLEIVASRVIRRCGRKSLRITLSSKADGPSKENEDKTGFTKPGISNGHNHPEESVSAMDSLTSHAAGTQTEGNRKKTWNLFKFLFGSRKRK